MNEEIVPSGIAREWTVMAEPLMPRAIRREGDRLVIDWSDGMRCSYTWPHLRKNCPCAGCREEREQPPDPFRILKPEQLKPLAPVSMAPMGRYAYKITWSDGHDTGIFTLEYLRELAQDCQPIPNQPS
jgi:DUF971 family protein